MAVTIPVLESKPKVVARCQNAASNHLKEQRSHTSPR